MKNDAKKAKESLSADADKVKKKKAQYPSLAKEEDWTFLEVYATRENWQNNFRDAESKITDGRAAEKELDALINENDKKKVTQIRTAIRRMSVNRKEALQIASKPFERADFLRDVKKRAPSLIEGAQDDFMASNKAHEKLVVHVGEAQSEFSDKKADLDKRLALITAMYARSSAALKSAEKENSSTAADYATLGDACGLVKDLRAKHTEADKVLRSKIGELRRDYSKILVDRKVNYFLTMVRYSWDSGADWDNTPDQSYKAEVPEDTFTYFDSFGANVAARVYSGWGSAKLDVKCNSTHWNRINVKGLTTLPRGDNDSEIHVEGFDAKYYHKYIIIENGTERETGWEQVNEDFFWDNDENESMEIVSKPLGMYEEETLKVAAPPGMATVGNPRHGEWKTDEGGRSYWSPFFTGMLVGHLFSGGGNRYYRGDYDYYRSNHYGRSAYYGRNADSPRYGTYGSSTSSSPRMARSESRKTGLTQVSSPSVRNASGGNKGGGPGTKGK